MRLRGLKFRKPWYTPPKSFPFRLEITIPLSYPEVHLVADDTLSMGFPGPAVQRIYLTANRTVALLPGDGLTVRGQVDGIDCRFMRHNDGGES